MASFSAFEKFQDPPDFMTESNFQFFAVGELTLELDQLLTLEMDGSGPEPEPVGPDSKLGLHGPYSLRVQ